MDSPECRRVANQPAAIGFEPRNMAVPIHFDPMPIQHGFAAAHRRQAALRRNVHFNQANGPHRVCVEMGLGAALVGAECPKQLGDALAKDCQPKKAPENLRASPCP